MARIVAVEGVLSYPARGPESNPGCSRGMSAQAPAVTLVIEVTPPIREPISGE
jgi:hypothetical protein